MTGMLSWFRIPMGRGCWASGSPGGVQPRSAAGRRQVGPLAARADPRRVQRLGPSVRPVASRIQVSGSVSTTLGGVPRVCRGPSTHCTTANGGTRTSVEAAGRLDRQRVGEQPGAGGERLAVVRDAEPGRGVQVVGVDDEFDGAGDQEVAQPHRADAGRRAAGRRRRRAAVRRAGRRFARTALGSGPRRAPGVLVDAARRARRSRTASPAARASCFAGAAPAAQDSGRPRRPPWRCARPAPAPSSPRAGSAGRTARA